MFQPIDFAAVARACGAAGFTVEDPARVGAVLDEAMAHRGPALVEAVVDPYYPPLPPKITAEQAYHFAKSLARGTREGDKIVGALVKEKIRELV